MQGSLLLCPACSAYHIASFAVLFSSCVHNAFKEGARRPKIQWLNLSHYQLIPTPGKEGGKEGGEEGREGGKSWERRKEVREGVD